MKYATIVESNESGLIQIIRAAEKFEESRFLQGIQQRCYTAEDIQWATDRVREYQQKLNTEARALAYFSEHFLKQYATNNNQCFEMAQLSFFQLDDPVLTQVRDEILGLDVNNLTPLEALNKLNEIKKIVSGK